MKALHIPLLALTLGAAQAAAQTAPGWAWLKAIDGTTSTTAENNSCTDLGRDAAGNLYVAGSFIGIANFDVNAQALSEGEDDVYVAKYTPAGSLVWLRQFRGTGRDKVLDLAVDAAGNTVVAGTFGGLTGGDLEGPDGRMLQGPRAYGLPLTGGGYGSFPFMASFDAQGNTRWATRVSPTYAVGNTGRMHGLELDRLGNAYWAKEMQATMIVGGQTYPLTGTYTDAFLLSYGPTGQVRWFRQVSSTGQVSSTAFRLDQTGAMYWQLTHVNAPITLPVNGSPVTSNQNQTLVKLNSGGGVKWLRSGWPTVGANNLQYNDLLSCDTTSNALYAEVSTLVNRTLSFDGSAAPVVLPSGRIGSVLVRCDTSGLATWARLVATASAGSNPTRIHSAAPTADGGVVLTASVPVVGSGLQLPTPQLFDAGGGVHAVLKYQPTSGTFAWLRSFGVPPTSQGPYSVLLNAAVDQVGNTYVAGFFKGTALFGPLSASTGSLPAYGFLAKLDRNAPLATRPRAGQLSWAVYPNPATDQCWLSGLPTGTAVYVLDALGRRVHTWRVPTTSAAVPVRGLAPGIYLVQPADRRFAPQRLLVQ